MAKMNVSLPDQLQAWMEARLERGRYASVSDDVVELIRRDRNETEERDAIVAALVKSEQSGSSSRTVQDIFAELKKERETAGE